MPALPLPRAAGAGGKPSLPLPPAAAGNILHDETRRQKECVDACAKLCADIQGTIDADVRPSITHFMETRAQTMSQKTAWPEESRSGVGIALRGCKIESFLPGVPAAKLMNVGDEIVEVDGVPINERTARDALLGSDVPGSFVTIRFMPHDPSPVGSGGTFWSQQIGLLPDAPSLKKSAGLQKVVLRRIPKELLAGRRVMLEYLRQMKIAAVRRDDREASDFVDKVLAHWLSMAPIEDQNRDLLAERDFLSNMNTHVTGIRDMLEDLSGRLSAIVDPAALDPLARENERLQKEVADLTEAYAPCPPLIAQLRQQLKETKEALEIDEVELHRAREEVQQAKASRVKLGSSGRVKLGAGAPVRAPAPAAEGNQLTLPALLVVFKKYDADNDGSLSLAETASALGELKMYQNREDVEKLFELLDQDGSGTLEWDEFQALARNAGDHKVHKGAISGITQLRKDNADMRTKIAEHEQLLPGLKKTIETLWKELAPMPADASLHDMIPNLQERISKTNDKMEKEEQETKRAKTEAETLSHEISELKKKLADATAKCDELKQDKERQEREMETLKAKLATSAATIEGLKQDVKTLRATEKAKDKEIDDLWRKLSNFEQVVLDLRTDLEESSTKCSGLEADLTTANGRLQDKSAQLSATKESLNTTEKDLRDTKEACKRADKTVAEQIRQLKAQSEQIEHLENELKDTKEEKEKEMSKAKAKQEESKKKIDTLTSDVRALKATEKAKDKEIDGLWKKMSDFENLVMELREKADEAENKCLALEADLRSANADLKDKIADLAEAKKKLSAAEKELREAKEASKKADRTIADHVRDAKKAADKIEGLESDLEDARKEKEREQDKLQKKLEEAKAKMDTLTSDIKALKATEKAKDKEIDGLWKKMSDFENLVMELRKNVEDGERKETSLSADLRSANSSIKDAKSETAEVERKLTAAVRESETQKRLLQEQTLEIASLQKAKTKAVTEINEIKEAKDKMSRESKSKVLELENSIADVNLQMTRELDKVNKKVATSKAKTEQLEKDLKAAKASEKAKDKEVDEAWTKMSNYEKVVMELREGSAVKDAELVELQKQIEKLSSQK